MLTSQGLWLWNYGLHLEIFDNRKRIYLDYYQWYISKLPILENLVIKRPRSLVWHYYLPYKMVSVSIWDTLEQKKVRRRRRERFQMTLVTVC